MNKESECLNQVLIQFEALVHKTMNRLNIPQNNMHYEDFTQKLQIQLIEIFQSFDGNPLDSEIDRYKFIAYAGQGLYWHGLNLLRQDNLEMIYPTDEEQIDWFIEGVEDARNNLYVDDFLQQAKPRLSDEDYLLVLYMCEGKYTVLELANLMGVSRDTIYQRRKKIQLRLKDLKECLIN